MTPTSKIFGHHIWQQIIAGTGLARPTNPLGAPSCPKLASRELLGYWGDAGKMGKGWKIGVSQKPVGYLCVSVCHGLSSCKFGTLCDIIQLGSGVVGLHCQNSREWMRMLRLCRPNCSYSTGIHGEWTFAFLQNWLVRSSGMEDSEPTENEPEDSWHSVCVAPHHWEHWPVHYRYFIDTSLVAGALEDEIAMACALSSSSSMALFGVDTTTSLVNIENSVQLCL